MHSCRNFSGSYAPFELRILAQIKYTTETVCHRNSSKLLNRILRNFVVDKDKLCTCAHLQEIFIWLFSKSTIRTWAKIYPVLFRASCVKWNWFSRNDREAVQSDIFLTVNQCYTNETIINQVWVYLIITDIQLWFSVWYCPSLMHGIAILYVQHCQAMLERGVCELACSLSPSLIPSIFCYTFFPTLKLLYCRWWESPGSVFIILSTEDKQWRTVQKYSY